MLLLWHTALFLVLFEVVCLRLDASPPAAGMQGLRMSDYPSGLPPSRSSDTGDTYDEGPLGGGHAAIACHLCLAIALVLVASQFTHLAGKSCGHGFSTAGALCFQGYEETFIFSCNQHLCK